MKQICGVRFSVVLSLVIVLTLPAIGISQITRQNPPVSISPPTAVKMVKVFTPVMSYRVVQYRSMVFSAGLWKRTGFKVVKFVKGTSIERSIGILALNKSSPECATYNITVTHIDVVKSDGSRKTTQTIDTTCDDGSKYSDSMTSVTDSKGNTTETQTVTATGADGVPTTESTTNTSSGTSGSGFSGGGGTDFCAGIMCSKSPYCCQVCKQPQFCGDLK